MICPECFEIVCECSEMARIIRGNAEAQAYAAWIEELVDVRVRQDAETAVVEVHIPDDAGMKTLAAFHKITPTPVPRWVWLAWEAKLEPGDELSLEVVD